MQGAASPLGGTLVASGTGVWVSEGDDKGHYNFPSEESFRWHQDRHSLRRRGVDEEAMLDCVAQVEETLGAPEWYKTFLGSEDESKVVPPAPPRNGYTANFGRGYSGLTIRSRKNKRILCVFTPCEFHSGGKDGIFEWFEERPEEKRSAMDIIVDMNAKLDGKFADLNSPIFTMGMIGGGVPQGVPTVAEARQMKLPERMRAKLVEQAYDYHHTYRSGAIRASIEREVRILMQEAAPFLAKSVSLEPVLPDYRVTLAEGKPHHLVHALASASASVVERPGSYLVWKNNIGNIIALCDRQGVDFVCTPTTRNLAESSSELAVKVQKKGGFFVADWEMDGISGSVYDQDKDTAAKKAVSAANSATGRISVVKESEETPRVSTAANKAAITKRWYEEEIKSDQAGIDSLKAAKTAAEFSTILPSGAKENWADWKKEKLASLEAKLKKRKQELADHVASMSESSNESRDVVSEAGAARPVGGLTRLWHSKDVFLNVRSSRIQKPKDSPYVYVSFPADEAQGFFGKVPDHTKLFFELGDGFYKPTPHSRMTKDDYYFTLEKVDAAEQPTLKKKYRV
jgi:hypothetical protein